MTVLGTIVFAHAFLPRLTSILLQHNTIYSLTLERPITDWPLTGPLYIGGQVNRKLLRQGR